MKKILFLFFLSFNIIFSADTLTTGNGKLAAEILKNSGGLRIKNDIKSAEFTIESLDIAVIIDGVIYPIKNFNKKTSYVHKTNIIKTSVAEKKFDLDVYYIPSMLQKDFFYVFIEVWPKMNKKDLNILYYISPGQKIGTLNYTPDGFVYGATKIKYEDGKKLFLSDDEDIFIPKMKEVEDGSKKYTDDKFVILDNLSLDGESMTTLLCFDFSLVKSDENNWELSQEISYWSSWLGEAKYKSNEDIIKQQLVFLKTMQGEDGEIVLSHVKNSVDSVESTLFAADAFIRYSFYEESKKGLSFVLEKAGKKELTAYEETLFLYVFANYLNEIGDLEFFYENSEQIMNLNVYSKMTDLSSGKVEIEGTGEIGTDYYLYMDMDALNKLGIEEFKNYKLPLLDLRIDFNLRYLEGDELVSHPEDTTSTEHNLLYIGLLPFKKRDEIIRKLIEAHGEDISSETSEVTIDLLLQMYSNRFSEYKDEHLLLILNKLIEKNDFIISEYLNKSGYIDSRIAGKYLLMMHDRGI